MALRAVAGRPSPLVEAIFRREIVPWALLGLTLGMVEGATAAVLLKRQFDGAADPIAVNFAVALVSGAPALSNVLSFVWANLAHGRARVGLLVALQAAFAVAIGLVGFAPRATAGLAFTAASVLAARMLWAGVLTVRAAVWTANYPRGVLARITGRIVVVSSLAIAVSAGAAGWAVQAHGLEVRWLYGGAAAAGLAAAWLYRRMRVRREFRLLAAENAAVGRVEPFSLRVFATILREDRNFRRYMFWIGLYGGGGLMLTAQLVVLFSDHLRLGAGTQIALLSVLPLAALPLFMPWWTRLFDRSHIVRYRSRQGWTLVLATAILGLGTFAGSLPLLWIGAVALGAANAGANLGWNLGHNDFASLGRAQQYMGVHVTLTGVRGMLAPPAGMALYQGLEYWAPGAGRFALLAPLAMSFAGAWGFGSMSRELQRRSASADENR